MSYHCYCCFFSLVESSHDSCSSEYPSKYCLGERFVDTDSYDIFSDSFGAGCFNAILESGYWKVKEFSFYSGS